MTITCQRCDAQLDGLLEYENHMREHERLDAQMIKKPHSYWCICGWNRIVLDGETMEDAKNAHDKTDIHHIAMRDKYE